METDMESSREHATDESLSALTDRCYEHTKTRPGLLYHYLGTLEGMLLVLSASDSETAEYVRRELNRFLGKD